MKKAMLMVLALLSIFSTSCNPYTLAEGKWVCDDPQMYFDTHTRNEGELWTDEGKVKIHFNYDFGDFSIYIVDDPSLGISEVSEDYPIYGGECREWSDTTLTLTVRQDNSSRLPFSLVRQNPEIVFRRVTDWTGLSIEQGQ